MSDVLIPQILRAGLTELLNLPDGIKQAITHIGLGTGQFEQTDEAAVSDTSDQVLLVPISDAIETSPGTVMFYGQAEWDGEFTPIYSIRFYLETGTILAAYSSTEVETALVKGQSNDLYYTLVLDAIPADKIKIVNTQVVFNPDVEESLQMMATEVITAKLKQAQNHVALRAELDEKHIESTQQLSSFESRSTARLKDAEEREADRSVKVEKLLERTEILTYASWSMFDYMTDINRIHFSSGVTHARSYMYGGDSPHNSPTTIGYSAYNGHDHGNIENLVGTAEFGIMWNGIYFRLRHNDDGLYRHANVGAASFDERVPLLPPAEPSDIAAATTAAEKCDLAEKYIRIMAGELPQDAVTDYANSARWIMTGVEVYPEVYSHGEELRDPFPGHRHQINVNSVPELLKQEQFYNNGGHKNIRENSVGIAIAINDIDDEGNPVVVLWRYRFISADVGSLAEYPINDTLDYYADTAYSARYGQTIEQIKASRSCRFRVKQRLGQGNLDNFYAPELIDEMIAKIPGLNGHGNTLTEEYQYYGANDQLKQFGDASTPLKAGYYNRFYTMTGNDASNRRNAKRGFSDDRLWVARTTDSRIKQTKFGNTVLGFSGFVPLELNIQSFLNGNFNPHGIKDVSDQYSRQEFMNMVNVEGYGKTQDKPLPGHNNLFFFYKSPADIFDGETPTDPADTTVAGGLWITCADGLARKHFPSGYRHFLPTKGLIGEQLRTRYPIYYAAEEGSESFKYLSAVQKQQETLLTHVIGNKLDVAKLQKQITA